MKVLLTFTASACCLASASAQSTIDPANKFAWSANGGFINFKPDQPAPSGGAVVNERFLSGFVYAANFGWINLGDGTPVNNQAYQNNSATDFGVNVSPDGSLTGFAYAANVGWINFEQTSGQPKLNLLTGKLTGFAYGANIGWINLASNSLGTLDMISTDSDGDGIGDEYEFQFFGGLGVANGSTDFDKDGKSDVQEYGALTDPTDRSDYLRIIDIGSTATVGALYKITFTTEIGRVYSVESSANLQSWTTIPSLTDFLTDGATTLKDIPSAGQAPPPRFWRVRAKKPL